MPSDGDSFLPRIQSVFYAVLDVRAGARIAYQVPEGLIPSSRAEPVVSPIPALSSSFSPPRQATPAFRELTGLTEAWLPSPGGAGDDQQSSRLGRHQRSPHKRTSSLSTNRTLFYFEDIAKYVIPPPLLCGRLVKCTTRDYRIMGFPVRLDGDRYARKEFVYNVCFVFEKAADLSCYEPIVRKVGRVLHSCEVESSFLSASETSVAMHAIIEQLYEDLNSYAETSIEVDQFNSIELKLFPFYPNPPAVKDWQVPLPLIDLKKVKESNWDLTVVKVCEYVDGVNHVSRIAHLADCDKDLTRKAISHLLYYQVVMMIDIFQYSNMYTLRKSIQWLAEEPHVVEECGAYITKEGKPPPDWPTLLHLYSRLKPGKTIMEWVNEFEIYKHGIDVRRFVSFGVIKGFLRRVHRYPILLPEPQVDGGNEITPGVYPPSHERTYSSSQNIGRSITSPISPGMDWSLPPIISSTAVAPSSASPTKGLKTAPSISSALPPDPLFPHVRDRNSGSAFIPPFISGAAQRSLGDSIEAKDSTNTVAPDRRPSAAETALAQLRNRVRGRSPAVTTTPSASSTPNTSTSTTPTKTVSNTPTTNMLNIAGRAFRPRGITHDEHAHAQGMRPASSQRRSLTPSALLPAAPTLGANSPYILGGMPMDAAIARRRSGSGVFRRARVESDGAAADMHTRETLAASQRPRFERSPSAPVARVGAAPPMDVPSAGSVVRTSMGTAIAPGPTFSPYPKKLLEFLNGETHTDAIGCELEAGWPLIERWLMEIGGGDGDNGFGPRVAIIYR